MYRDFPVPLPACPTGLGIHHAGMLRPDRNIMERAFGQGIIKARRGIFVCGGGGCGPVWCSSMCYNLTFEALPACRCCAARPRWPGASTCRRTP